MGATRTAKSKNQSYWQKQIKSWKGSGLSQREYCRRSGISASTFSYWHRKLQKQKKVELPQFYPLTLPNVPEVGSNESGLRLFLHERKYCIDIEKEFSAASLRKIITTLEAM